MAKTTIYLPDELAAELAKIPNVSAVCQRAIREELQTMQAITETSENVERIEVEIEGPQGVRVVRFLGRWLIEPEPDETRSTTPGTDAGVYWGVALTKRGRIAVYSAHCNRGQGSLHDYDWLDDAEEDGVPPDILGDARAALLGETPVSELDI